MKVEALTVDEWKAKLGVESYYAVAKHLGVGQSTVAYCAKRGRLLYMHGGNTYIAKEAKSNGSV